MIVTLKPVKYEAVQYTGPDQSQLPPLVIVATKGSLEESRRLEKEISWFEFQISHYDFKYSPDGDGYSDSESENSITSEQHEENKESLDACILAMKDVPPYTHYSKGEYRNTKPGDAIFKHGNFRQKVDMGDWIVKCTPVEGKLPGMKTRNESGYWIISGKQFSEMFAKG